MNEICTPTRSIILEPPSSFESLYGVIHNYLETPFVTKCDQDPETELLKQIRRLKSMLSEFDPPQCNIRILRPA